jgi:hypothetical protein
MNQTAQGVTFSQQSESMDPTGSVVISTAVIDGNVMGSPINGRLRIEEVRTRPAETNSGSIEGQFTITDGFGNTIQGDMSGDYTLGPGSSNATGQFTIRGGTGPFATASGTGTFTETISEPGMGPSVVTFTGSSVGTAQLQGVSGPPGYPYNGIMPPGYIPPAPSNVNLERAYAEAQAAAVNNGLVPGTTLVPNTTFVPNNGFAPGYVPPSTSGAYYDRAYAESQARSNAAAAAAQAAAQSAPNVILVPIPESEWDPNGVFDRPARSANSNRNYR